MILSFVLCLFIGLAGNTVIYSGLALINGSLLPGLLHGFYEATTPLIRTLIMTFFLAVPANYVFAKMFQVGTPAIASMAMLISVVIVLSVKATLLEDASLTRIIPAVLLSAMSLGYLGYVLVKNS